MSVNDFQIIKDIGKGSFGSVHKVRRLKDNLLYAMKKVKLNKLNTKEKYNSINEIRLLASIKNDNIISYKESFYDQDNQTLCVIMEYADNGDLEEKIFKKIAINEKFTETEILSCFIQIIRGLKHLHSNKILHRDIKSANIFLNKNGSIKVGDLNISKVIKEIMKNTQTGTPFYASPEIWNNDAYDFKSDIWSLGCLLYELCSLKPPFLGDSIQNVFELVNKGKYEEIDSYYSDFLKNIISSTLRVNPKQRPSSKLLWEILENKFSSSLLNMNNTQFFIHFTKFHNLNKINLDLKELNNIAKLDDIDDSNENNPNLLLFSNKEVLLINSLDIENNEYYFKLSIKTVNEDKNIQFAKNKIINLNPKSLLFQQKSNLLKTIQLPRRLFELNKILPKSNYIKHIVKENIAFIDKDHIDNNHINRKQLINKHEPKRLVSGIKPTNKYHLSPVKLNNKSRNQKISNKTLIDNNDKKQASTYQIEQGLPSIYLNNINLMKNMDNDSHSIYPSSNIYLTGEKIIVQNIIKNTINSRNLLKPLNTPKKSSSYNSCYYDSKRNESYDKISNKTIISNNQREDLINEVVNNNHTMITYINNKEMIREKIQNIKESRKENIILPTIYHKNSKLVNSKNTESKEKQIIPKSNKSQDNYKYYKKITYDSNSNNINGNQPIEAKTVENEDQVYIKHKIVNTNKNTVNRKIIQKRVSNCNWQSFN